jgi:hypothetical protein
VRRYLWRPAQPDLTEQPFKSPDLELYTDSSSFVKNGVRGSEMVTRVQKQIAWAPQIKNLAETLEPHLSEIKHQKESKLWHPEPLTHTKLLNATLHWENRTALRPPDTGSKPAWETFSRPTGEYQASCGIPPATPGINQHNPLGRLTPTPQKKLNKQGTEN